MKVNERYMRETIRLVASGLNVLIAVCSFLLVKKLLNEGYVFISWAFLAVGILLILGAMKILTNSRLIVRILGNVYPIRSIRFNRTFGFWPKKGEPKSIVRLSQSKVDLRLSILAGTLEKVCQNEDVFNRESFTVTDNIAQKRRLAKIHKKVVEEAKDRFWAALGLAKAHGYRVKQSHKSYIN